MPTPNEKFESKLDAIMSKMQTIEVERNQFYGEVPGYHGIWVVRPSRSDCAAELRKSIRVRLSTKLKGDDII